MLFAISLLIIAVAAAPVRHVEPITLPITERAGSTVTTTDFGFDRVYTVDVAIGTPPQILPLQVDTGSSDLVVYNSECYVCRESTIYRFDGKASSTYQEHGRREMYYGGGNVSGRNASEIVTIGGKTVPDQLFLSGTIGTMCMSDYPGVSGTLGLAPTGHQGGPDDTSLFARLHNQWTDKVVGMHLARHGDGVSGFLDDAHQQVRFDNVGEITFGGVNHNRFTGDLHMVPVVDNQPWVLKLEGVSVNGKDVFGAPAPPAPPVAPSAPASTPCPWALDGLSLNGIPLSGGPNCPDSNPNSSAKDNKDANSNSNPSIPDMNVLVDSGVRDIYLPADIVAPLYAAIPGSSGPTMLPNREGGAYTIPCDTKAVVGLKFGGETYDIHPASLRRWKVPGQEGLCYGTIIEGRRPLVGVPLFHSAYLAFQYEPLAVGFGKLVQ